ncbi:MAG TPA: Ig-like domain-containing protein [Gemmatimonadales bacterium]|nr:Ig-like domain-containing protein [Gemmatimonadales bacterium]
MRQRLIFCAALALASTCTPATQPDSCSYPGGCGKDTIPPVTTWVTPLVDTLVTGTIALRVNVADLGGVFGVAFLVNGITPIGTPALLTTEPYETTWNSGEYPNGDTVALVAIALDKSGNADTVIRREVPNNCTPVPVPPATCTSPVHIP